MSTMWVTAEDLGDYGYTEFTTEAIQTASYLLWAMSGRKYSGITTVTERYNCKSRNYQLGASALNYAPILVSGDVYQIPTDQYDDFSEIVADGLSPESRVKLRGRPVNAVLAVRSGSTGNVIDASGYYLVDHSTIQLRAGSSWTPCNLEITYTYGADVPAIGRMAARTLAIEFIKLWSNDEECALPQRVTSVARQGVSYTILDQQDFIQELRTGMYAIDLFIKTANPDGARVRPKVFSPDSPRARRYTPKPYKLTASATDIVVPLSGNGTLQLTVSGIGANFLLTETGWNLSVTVRNWSGAKSTELDTVALNTATGAITITTAYDDLTATLGMVDPGTWDLYATKTVNNIPTVVDLSGGNIKINLAG
jgi:hypothetical protein